jgi:pyrroline-5-carboxylate reductase
MRVAFIGGGVMGETLIAGLLRAGLAAPREIVASDISPQRRDALSERCGIATTDDNRRAAEGAELLFLAVKPQDYDTVAPGLRGSLNAEQTVVSIMAGVRIEALREGLGHDAIVRAMPNTPAQVGEGVSVWTATDEVSPEARKSVAEILAAIGKEIYVREERHIDIATAVSASGPGFLFLVMEALIDGAVHLGLRREVATAMVTQTVLGSARFAEETGRHPAELRNLVTSPGGTTAEGLLVLESAGVRAALIDAVVAAYERARALGGQDH